jgi:polyferredoxin
MNVRYVRYSLLFILTGMVVYLALGYGSRSFEAYCPFGGAESLWGLIKAGEYSCALGPLNLSLLMAVVGLTVVSKKSFCGWACPIGFASELLGRVGGKALGEALRPGPRLDRALRLLRYPVLVIFLYLTYKSGELILRGYDPFYLIFSGFGHGSAGAVSYYVLGALIIGSLLIPMFFCRYLCPLGAVLDPFSRVGLIQINRDAQHCTDCGECQVACPHAIPVQTLARVKSRDCTNCLECFEACPEEGVLTLRVGPRRS